LPILFGIYIDVLVKSVKM